MMQVQERIQGALYGCAIGDALGIAAGHYSEEGIVRCYGHPIREITQQVRHFGSVAPKWRRGDVSDDTCQTLAVAQAIVDAGRVSREHVGRALLSLSERYCSERTACGRFRAKGNPNNVALGGHGNGAAMRVAPIGLVTLPQDQLRLIDDIVQVCTLTHNTPEALCGAAAVAAAVSAAAEGWATRDVVAFAVSTTEGVEAQLPKGHQIGFGARIVAAVAMGPRRYVQTLRDPEGWGYSAWESIPCVMAHLVMGLEVQDALLHCANLGGDADTTCSMLGGILGALTPWQLPQQWVDLVDGRNRLPVLSLASGLAGLRCRRRAALQGGDVND